MFYLKGLVIFLGVFVLVCFFWGNVFQGIFFFFPPPKLPSSESVQVEVAEQVQAENGEFSAFEVPEAEERAEVPSPQLFQEIASDSNWTVLRVRISSVQGMYDCRLIVAGHGVCPDPAVSFPRPHLAPGIFSVVCQKPQILAQGEKYQFLKIGSQCFLLGGENTKEVCP